MSIYIKYSTRVCKFGSYVNFQIGKVHLTQTMSNNAVIYVLFIIILTDLLRRLSKSQDTVFCGRIQLFLARFFPLDEKSGKPYNINILWYNILSKSKVVGCVVQQKKKMHKGLCVSPAVNFVTCYVTLFAWLTRAILNLVAVWGEYMSIKMLIGLCVQM